jgi:hypothetical protein
MILPFLRSAALSCDERREKKLKTGKLCDLEREEAQSAMTTAPARMQMKARIGVDLETLKT